MKSEIKILKLLLDQKNERFTIKKISETLKINYRIAYENVIKLEKEGKSHKKYFFGGLGLVTTMAASIVGFCYFYPEFLVSILFGKEYISISPLLWQYAFATALFACSNVFVYYHLSLDQHQPVWITNIVGIAQISLISNFHQSFEQVIYVQILLMSFLFVALVCFYFFKKR